MKVAIMQPYFLPYIGYFQLIHSADQFIVYDNIKYTKKGWINRNRFLRDGADVTFSVPLKKDSDYLDVRERKIASDFDRSKLLNQIREAYRRAPFFQTVFPLFENIVSYRESDLFKFIYHSIEQVCIALSIKTEIKVSSTILINNHLQNQDKVLALCGKATADMYINAIGGTDLYLPSAFESQGIALRFLKSKPFEYKQFDKPFVPWLSIVDVMMFNPLDKIMNYLSEGYELIMSPKEL